MTALAAGCAALALVLWLPSSPRTRIRGVTPWAGPATWVLAPLGAFVALTMVPVVSVGVLAVAALSLVGAGRLWRRRAVRLAADREAARVLESCEQLAAELGAGQPPGTALQRVAADHPSLSSAAEAFLLGADVPEALRDAARQPGAEDLRLLAAGWQVAHRTGSGLAVAVGSISTSLRAAEATRRLVAGELASARATARLVALLPFLALAMGSGAGGDPWRFLLGTLPGLGCLAAGLALGLTGLWWIEALTGDPG